MNKFVVSGAIAALAVATAGSASANVTGVFVANQGTPEAGYTVVDDFSTNAGLSGSGFVLDSTPGSTTTGAQPDEGVNRPAVPYLDVMAGGTATITFAGITTLPVHAFEFDWGSVDTFNHLTIYWNGGLTSTMVTPPSPATGNQTAALTNGLFRVTGDAGETFTKIVLTSDQDSFEIDNLAIPVPEPASWAMMILGFGAIGFAMRRRGRMVAAV